MPKVIETKSNIEILQGDFRKHLRLEYALGIKAGFTSPAGDYQHEGLDFNRDLIRHPEATFYGRVISDSMVDAGINEGDLVVIDRALEPRTGDVIVAFIDQEFTIKYLDLRHQKDGYIELKPANKKYLPIRVTADDDFEVWGVAIWSIKPWRRM